MTTLDFKTYAHAKDCHIDDGRYLGCSMLCRTEDWYRLFELAQEMVEKYGLDGASIPVGAKVLLVSRAQVWNNRKRGYNGITGGKGTYLGLNQKDPRYFDVKSGDSDLIFYQPCWWRFIAVLPDDYNGW